MSRLVNTEMEELVNRLSTYQSNIVAAVYEQYKSSTVLSRTINLKGETGDSMKEYMETVHINLTQKVINVSAELLEVACKMRESFLTYESDINGIVGTGTLDQEKKQLDGNNQEFDKLDEHGQNLVGRAAEFISTIRLPGETVHNTYEIAKKNIKETKGELLQTDQVCVNRIRPVTERINELLTEMYELSAYFKNKNGVISDKVKSIKEQPWYSLENSGAFKVKSEEDPFSYKAGHKSLGQDQWVFGTSDSNYLSGTGYLLGMQGQQTINNGTYKANGEIAVAKGDLKGVTLFGLGKLDTEGEVLSGKGELEFNRPDNFLIHGNVSAVKAKSTAIIGTENFNGYASVKAKVLDADGIIAFKNPKDRDDSYHYGFGGTLDAASASAETGFTLFGMNEVGGEYKLEDGHKVEPKKEFGLNGSVSAGVQGGARLEVKDDVVVNTKYVNIRATEITGELKLLLGVDFDATVPIIQLKWPW